MIRLDQITQEMSEDIESVQAWAAELYDKCFGNYLKDVKDLYVKLQDKSRPISDGELEQILTTLPLELINISEVLSQFKISKEVVALTMKQKEADHIATSDAPTVTQKREDAANAVLEYKLVHTVYSSVITRVEREIDFARELIMSSKKIWDARKHTEGANPIGDVVPESSKSHNLPDYASVKGKSQQYIT